MSTPPARQAAAARRVGPVCPPYDPYGPGARASSRIRWQDRMAQNARICVRHQQRCCWSGPIEVLCALSGFLPLVAFGSMSEKYM